MRKLIPSMCLVHPINLFIYLFETPIRRAKQRSDKRWSWKSGKSGEQKVLHVYHMCTGTTNSSNVRYEFSVSVQVWVLLPSPASAASAFLRAALMTISCLDEAFRILLVGSLLGKGQRWPAASGYRENCVRRRPGRVQKGVVAIWSATMSEHRFRCQL